MSIVVPCHALGAPLDACLASIAALQPAPFERILACDGTFAGRDADAPAGLFRMVQSAGRGPAAARNEGARVATGEILLFLDSDVSAPTDLVGRVTEIFLARPELAALIGSYDDAPRESGLVSQYRNLLHHFVHQTSSAEAHSFWGACGAIRSDWFSRLGGFDERYVAPSIEDIELGLRVRRAGGAIQLAREVQVKHLKRWTLASFLWTDLRHRALPWSRLILRDGRMPNDLNLRMGQRLAVAATCAIPPTLLLGAGDHAWHVVSAGLFVVFAALNAPFLAFLWRRKGPLLAALAVPLHLLHSLAGGLGLALAGIEWAWSASRGALDDPPR